MRRLKKSTDLNTANKIKSMSWLIDFFKIYYLRVGDRESDVLGLFEARQNAIQTDAIPSSELKAESSSADEDVTHNNESDY